MASGDAGTHAPVSNVESTNSRFPVSGSGGNMASLNADSLVR